MGKSEILMLLAGIALSILIALVTIPTFTKGSDVAKISLINSDLSSIRKAGEMYIQSKSTTGNFENIDVKKISQFIPSLKLKDGNRFISSANEKITYNIEPEGKDQLRVTIEGLKVIDDARSKVKETQSKVGLIHTDDSVNGILVIIFNG